MIDMNDIGSLEYISDTIPNKKQETIQILLNSDGLKKETKDIMIAFC